MGARAMRAWTSSTKRARTLRRAAGRCAALVFALALLAGLAGAGSRYFYCPVAEAVVGPHCCPHQSPEPSGAVQQPDCCEARTIGALPSASTTAPPSPLAAPLLAVLVPVLDVHVIAPTPAGRFVSRSGLSPPPPARRSAQQIVLLT